MPIDIDPEWEYYTPDPEIAALFYFSGWVANQEAFANYFHDRRKEEFTSGIRVGKGDPNGFWGKLAPEPRKYKEKEPPEWRRCVACNGWFEPDRHERRYCKRSCVPHKGRERELPESLMCAREGCEVTFRPRNSGSRYCSLQCASVVGGNKVKGQPTREIDRNLFRTMWLDGASVESIRQRFRLSKKGVKLWRKRLGLSARPSGNHSKKKGGIG